jgi:phenylalanyl-tRNA synthetase beta chain
VLGYDQLPATPPRGPDHCRACREQSRSLTPVRRAPGRPGLPGNDQLQLRRGALGGTNWPATPIRSGCSTRLPQPMSVMRSSLHGQPGAACHAPNLARALRRGARARDRAACFRRDAAVRGSLVRRGRCCTAAARRPGLAYGSADGRAVGAAERPVDLLRRQGRLRGPAGAVSARTSCPTTHPALHPGRCARVAAGGQVDRPLSANCHPRWRQAYELPHGARSLFELDLDAVLERRCPPS